MALSRDTRMDRRRRALWDASTAEQAEGSTNRRRESSERTPDNSVKKSAGYSQDVRQACGVRLVQLIPVRRRSFTALMIASVMVTAGLLAAHYFVYVNGQLPWYGHPLAIALDATHPQSIASWLGSHLWLMCLGTTILTFQLRRHKLDDYNGEYRLWFWLVITCVIASIDSTTHITELFGHALDKWTRINIGWSGPAVVLATLSALIGLLGLRLCSELKAVPFSLICWLIGLTAWAGSAALAQEMFRIDIAIQTRIWLRASLWLGGLTCIWIASVAYLRHVYIEAQRRFLARGLMARRNAAVPLAERVRQSMPFRRRRNAGDAEQAEAEVASSSRWNLRRIFSKRNNAATDEVAQPRKRRARSERSDSVPTVEPVAAAPSTSARPAAPLAAPLSAANRQRTDNNAQSDSAGQSASPMKRTRETAEGESGSTRRWPFSMRLWPGKAVRDDEAEEYRKVQNDDRQRLAEERRAQREAARAEKTQANEVRLAERQAAKQAKRDARANKQTQTTDQTTSGNRLAGLGRSILKPATAVGGAFKKLKLPSLSAFKLTPPDTDQAASGGTSGQSGMKINRDSRSLPGTAAGSNSQVAQSNSNNYDSAEDDQDDRFLSKAERKKNRRQNRAA